MGDKGKELREALERLEKCCPGSTCDPAIKNASTELHKALLNLDRARGREERLREESEALLKGMNIIINSENSREAFQMVLNVLKSLLDFDDAFVLREQNDGTLSAVASSSFLFEDPIWPLSAMFRHVLAGNFANLHDISTSTDWQAQPPEIRAKIKAALHTPFNTMTDRAILVCTSSQTKFFDKSRIQLLQRFAPLAGQALHNLEINDRLRGEIIERKQTEKRLEKALTALQNTKEELLTTNEALKEAHDNLELRVEKRTEELRASNVLLQREINERKRAEKEKKRMEEKLWQAREAGMAEMASEVLHNIGNAITPAKIAALNIRRRLEKGPCGKGFNEVLNEFGMIIDAAPALPEKEKLRCHRIIELLPQILDDEMGFFLIEIVKICEKHTHIENIINLQRKYTYKPGLYERVRFNDMVEDAVKILHDSLRQCSISITRNFAELPEIRVERSRMLEMLLALFKNGMKAVNGIKDGKRCLSLATSKEEGPPAAIVFSISNNGRGYTDEEIKHLFRFGPGLTDPDEGLEMHNAANYVNLIHGFIEVKSPGPGLGATFTVRLPLVEKQ